MENLDLTEHVHVSKSINCHFIEFEKEYEFKELEMKIGTLVWESDEKYNILRMKGVFNVKDESNCIYAL